MIIRSAEQHTALSAVLYCAVLLLSAVCCAVCCSVSSVCCAAALLSLLCCAALSLCAVCWPADCWSNDQTFRHKYSTFIFIEGWIHQRSKISTTMPPPSENHSVYGSFKLELSGSVPIVPVRSIHMHYDIVTDCRTHWIWHLERIYLEQHALAERRQVNELVL